jgi:hypothetical protein
MYTEVMWVLVGLAGLGAVARSCRRPGQNPASEDTLHYYARGGRQTRRRAFIDWSHLPGSSGNPPESPGTPRKFRLKRRETKRTEKN